MSESGYESDTRGRRKVCVKYVDSGGHCRYDCEDLHPLRIGQHVSIRARQLRKNTADAQVYVCPAGGRCRKLAWGICPNSHAQDARDSRGDTSGIGNAAPAQPNDEVVSQPSSSSSRQYTARRTIQPSPVKSKNTKKWPHERLQEIDKRLDALGPPIQILAPRVHLIVPNFNPHTYFSYLVRPEVLAYWLQDNKQRDIGPDDLNNMHGKHKDILGQAIKDAFKGWPLIFYAVQSSRPRILDFLLDCGTSSDVYSPTGMPLLAFVILCQETTCRELMTKVLLDRGADPRVIPLGALTDGHIKADNAPGWMKTRRDCASLFASFKLRITPGIAKELRIQRALSKRSSFFDRTPKSSLMSLAVSTSRVSQQHITQSGTSLCNTPTSTIKTLNDSSIGDSPQTSVTSHDARGVVHQGHAGPASVVLLSISKDLPHSSLEELSHALGAGMPLILPARFLCNQYPELRKAFRPGEDPQSMQWPIDHFIRRTEGRRAMILIDSIDQGLDSSSAAWRLLCQWWERGIYKSRLGADYDIRNIIWVLTCPRYSHDPPISGLKNVRRSEALDPVWPLLAYELTWPNTLRGAEMASLLRALANDASREKPVIDRSPSSKPPPLPPLPPSPSMLANRASYVPSVLTVYPETAATTPSLQEDPRPRASMETIESVPDTIATPPLTNLLDDPLDEIEADSLPPPIQAKRLAKPTYGGLFDKAQNIDDMTTDSHVYHTMTDDDTTDTL